MHCDQFTSTVVNFIFSKVDVVWSAITFLWLLEHIFKRENVESIYDYRGSKTYKILKVGRQQVCEDRAKSSSVQQIRASS